VLGLSMRRTVGRTKSFHSGFASSGGITMCYKGWLIAAIIIVLIIVAAALGALRASISALPEPGAFETSMATKAKDWYIGRAAREPLPLGPPNNPAGVTAGSALFGMDCASCHGQDGRTPTAIGKSMYPRVPGLGSPEVQSLSDRELFWVVRNGIRLSGMPGFAHIDTDEQIWQLTYYVRSLGTQAKK